MSVSECLPTRWEHNKGHRSAAAKGLADERGPTPHRSFCEESCGVAAPDVTNAEPTQGLPQAAQLGDM